MYTLSLHAKVFLPCTNYMYYNNSNPCNLLWTQASWHGCDKLRCRENHKSQISIPLSMYVRNNNMSFTTNVNNLELELLIVSLQILIYKQLAKGITWPAVFNRCRSSAGLEYDKSHLNFSYPSGDISWISIVESYAISHPLRLHRICALLQYGQSFYKFWRNLVTFLKCCILHMI